jgi:hypothetical protein
MLLELSGISAVFLMGRKCMSWAGINVISNRPPIKSTKSGPEK